ncbi:MAG: hypothetical protein J5974_09325, partial [Pyramidobacter sp.]|nr:hypothetical protein [Pyramidobacter sp.]
MKSISKTQTSDHFFEMKFKNFHDTQHKKPLPGREGVFCAALNGRLSIADQRQMNSAQAKIPAPSTIPVAIV